MRGKQQPHCPWAWQWAATSDQGGSPNLLMTFRPPTLSKAAGGCGGQRAAGDRGARDSPSPHPGDLAGKPGERGHRRALTFPIKIIVWDANINETLEDLQGEQRRAAGVTQSCTGPSAPESAHEHSRERVPTAPTCPAQLGPGMSSFPSMAGCCNCALTARASATSIFVFYDANPNFSPRPARHGQQAASTMTVLFLLLLFFCQKKKKKNLGITLHFFLTLQSTHPRLPKENWLNGQPLAKFLPTDSEASDISTASASEAANSPPPGRATAA